MDENSAFTRVGSAQVIAKIEDVFTVQITLNGNPDSMWLECFTHPTVYTDNESHPSRTIVRGNKVVFFSVESELEKNVVMIDKYLKQANDCYSKKLVQELSVQNKQTRQRKMKQDELDRVNKDIENF